MLQEYATHTHTETPHTRTQRHTHTPDIHNLLAGGIVVDHRVWSRAQSDGCGHCNLCRTLLGTRYVHSCVCVCVCGLRRFAGQLIQAEDRCHRMGTTFGTINVHYCVAEVCSVHQRVCMCVIMKMCDHEHTHMCVDAHTHMCDCAHTHM